jgi:hypothetical protein
MASHAQRRPFARGLGQGDLTGSNERTAYVRQVAQALRPGGHVIIGTFGSEGPVRCSGLDVVRYDSNAGIRRWPGGLACWQRTSTEFSRLSLRSMRSAARSGSSMAAVSTSESTAETFVASPYARSATAVCAFVHQSHSFVFATSAAISSRSPTDQAGPYCIVCQGP